MPPSTRHAYYLRARDAAQVRNPVRCAECRAVLLPVGRHGAVRYCSKECRRRAHNRQARESYQRNVGQRGQRFAK